jgi:hypothetical protein
MSGRGDQKWSDNVMQCFSEFWKECGYTGIRSERQRVRWRRLGDLRGSYQMAGRR